MTLWRAENINQFNRQADAREHMDLYILKGGDWETWELRFVYHGFRYVEVSGVPEDYQLEGRFVHTDLPIIGEFSCSDEMLNKIHMAARWSTLSNFHSIPEDCPHREQNGWTGAAVLSAEQALMNYDMAGAYRKWMDGFKEAQRPSGQLPGIIPTGGWGFNWGSGPAWDCALISQMWEIMERYMRFLETMQEEYILSFGLGIGAM